MQSRLVLCGLVALGTWPLHTTAIESNPDVSVTQVLRSSHTWSGAPITYPAGTAEVTCLIIEIAPGGETGWHEHSVPSFALVLDGVLEVRLASGATKQIHAGEGFAEVIDTQHNGRNIGPSAVKLAVFYTGVVGKSLSTPRSR